jgi:hypothetical protein
MQRAFVSIALGALCFFMSYAQALTLSDWQRDPSLLMNADAPGVAALTKEIEKSSLPESVRRGAISKIRAFSEMKTNLERCLAGLEDSRGLRNSMLAGALSNPCLKLLSANSPQTAAIDAISEAIGATNFAQLQTTIANRTLTNSARTIAGYRTGFQKAATAPSKRIDRSDDNILAELCKNCSPEQKALFRTTLADETKKGSPERFEFTQIITLQNDVLTGLNKQIDLMIEAKEKGDEAALSAAYDRYVSSYQRFVSTPLGALFMTDTIRDHVGRMITPEDFKREFIVAGKKTLPKHKLLTTGIQDRDRINKAVTEMETKVGQFGGKVLAAKNFSDLLKADPATVGMILLNNPQLYSQICGALQDIVKSDAMIKSSLEVADSIVTAVDVASMSLMFTGAGGVAAKGASYALEFGIKAAKEALVSKLKSSAGRAALKSAAGSVQVGDFTAAQIMSATAVTGAVSEASHIGTDGTKLARSSSLGSTLIASRMAQATTDLEVKRVTEIEREWDKAFSTLTKGTALNALPLYHGIMKVRASGLLRLGTKSPSLGSVLSTDEQMKKVFEALGPEGVGLMNKMISQGYSPDELAAALAEVAKLPRGFEQLAIIVKNGKLTPENIKEFTDIARKALQCLGH